jgi:hypothetical protein
MVTLKSFLPLMVLGESTSDSAEAAFVALLVPQFRPHAGADRVGILTQRLASVIVPLLSTQQPFVVTVPAVQGLVVTGEAFVAGCCTSGHDLAEASGLFLVEIRSWRAENLSDKRTLNGKSIYLS